LLGGREGAAEISLKAGENDIVVEAEFPGALYNILVGSIIRTISVLDGIESIAVPQSRLDNHLRRDRELDEDYRRRIKGKRDAKETDNRLGKYEHIALAADGVDGVVVIRTPRGFGSIDPEILILGARLH